MNKFGPRAMDGRWSWLIVLGSFLIQVIVNGVVYSFGVVYVDFLAYFKAGEAVTAGTGSLQTALVYLTGAFSGPLQDRFGFHAVAALGCVISATGFFMSYFVNNVGVLYVTYGLLPGIGFGFMYMTSLVIIQRSFDKRRSLATGIAVAGSGTGILLFGFINHLLLVNVQWRLTLVVNGAIVLAVGLASAVIFRISYTTSCEDKPLLADGTQMETYNTLNDEPESTSPNNSIESSSDPAGSGRDPAAVCSKWFIFLRCDLCRNPRLVIYSSTVLLFSFGYQVPYAFIPVKATQMYELGEDEAAFLVSCIGISNIVSRFICGFLSDWNAKLRFVLMGSVLFLCGVNSVLSFLYTTYPLLITFASLFGSLSGMYASLIPVVAVDLLGLDDIEYNVGFSYALTPPALFSAAPISGLIIDSGGSYNDIFYMVGAAQVIGAILHFSILLLPVKYYPTSSRDHHGTARTFFYSSS